MALKLTAILLFLYILPLCYGQVDNTETVVKNAAFVDVAPCPCDLTQGSCDFGCCCDGECSQEDVATFAECIPFLPGGQSGETQTYKCASNHFAKEDWFPFLCVQFEYNALLGYFYDWQNKITSLQAFLRRLYSETFYSYKEEDDRSVIDTISKGYAYGISVKTGKPNLAAGTILAGTLTIPQPSITGSCIDTAPVRYLKNLDVSCTYEVSAALCTSSSVLSHLFYIQSSNIPGSATTYFSVLREDTGNATAETFVNYKCAPNADSYIKSTQVMSDLVDNTQAYTFNYALPSDPNCVDVCGNDTCIDLDNLPGPPPTPANIPDCPNQNPTAPTWNNGVCQNAVIDVDYQIRWNGNKIDRVDATIITADIGPSELSQRHKVTFTHNVLNTNATDNFNNITGSSYERSGKVGYDFGKDIFSGTVVRNTTTDPIEFLYVNTSTLQMALFDAGADGLCINAGRRSIRFDEDTTTSCRLMLGLAELSNCSGLRKLIFNRLNDLMPSDVLGRRGYNDPTNLGYWVNVLRDDLSETCQLSEYFPVGLSPVDNRTGICYNVTNAIRLDILYAATGQSDGMDINEILGSRISYGNQTLALTCTGPAGTACTGLTTQPFYLTSSVRFIKIPPQVQEPPAKYFETPTEDDVELCPGDRCWDNLFYPLTGRYRSEDFDYVYGMFAVSVIFFIGYLMVTRPWW